MKNTLNTKSALLLADMKYRDQPVLFPILGASNLVLLPRFHAQFIVDQPDSIFDIETQIDDSIQTKYTIVTLSLVPDPANIKLISATLTSQIGNLAPDMADEIACGFKHHWGHPSEYSELCVYETMRKIIGSATNRVFIGKPLCRNQQLYAKAVPTAALILRFLWQPLRPLVAPLLTLPIRLYTRRFVNPVAWGREALG